jgi:hypothetical protein
MKGNLFIRNLLIIIVILLALNIILPLLSNPATSYAAKNIEYKVVDLYADISPAGLKENYEQIEKLFNEYSKEGWEYVGQLSNNNVIFKK